MDDNSKFNEIVEQLRTDESIMFVWHCLREKYRINKLSDSEIAAFIAYLEGQTKKLKEITNEKITSHDPNYEENLLKVADELFTYNRALKEMTFDSVEKVKDGNPSEDMLNALKEAIKKYHEVLYPLAYDVQKKTEGPDENEKWSPALNHYGETLNMLRSIRSKIKYHRYDSLINAMVKEARAYRKGREVLEQPQGEHSTDKSIMFVWHCLREKDRINKLSDSEIAAFIAYLEGQTKKLKEITNEKITSHDPNYEENLLKVADELFTYNRALKEMTFDSVEKVKDGNPSEDMLNALKEAIKKYHEVLYPLAYDVQKKTEGPDENEKWSPALNDYADTLFMLRSIQSNIEYHRLKPIISAMVERARAYRKGREVPEQPQPSQQTKRNTSNRDRRSRTGKRIRTNLNKGYGDRIIAKIVLKRQRRQRNNRDARTNE